MTDQPTNPKSDPVAAFLASRSTQGLCRSAQVERAAVGKILKAAGANNNPGHPIQTFDDLFAGAGFPMRLFVALPSKHESSGMLGALMKRPTKSFAYCAYRDAVAECTDEACVAIVMPLYGGLWCFHAWPTPTMGTAGFYTRIDDTTYYFEKLASLSARIGPASEW